MCKCKCIPWKKKQQWLRFHTFSWRRLNSGSESRKTPHVDPPSSQEQFPNFKFSVKEIWKMIFVFSFTLCRVSRFGNGQPLLGKLHTTNIAGWKMGHEWVELMYFLLRLWWKPPGIGSTRLGMSFLRDPRAPFNFLHALVPFGTFSATQDALRSL